MNGRSPENIGNRHPAHAPHGAYPCEGEDAWVTIAVTSDEQWRNLAEEMGDSDLANDARFADLISRYRHQDELDEIISSWTRDKSGQEIMRALQSRGISCAPVYKVEDIFNDPQFQDRELLELVDHPATGPYFLPGAPWKMSGTPGKVRWPAPTLGQHNRVVFGEVLGMSDAQIQGLDDAGVTGTVPDPMKNTAG